MMMIAPTGQTGTPKPSPLHLVFSTNIAGGIRQLHPGPPCFRRAWMKRFSLKAILNYGFLIPKSAGEALAAPMS
jgi:hypothetical protein